MAEPAAPTAREPQKRGSPAPRTIVLWTAVALVGALGWAMLALSRDEEVSAAWMVAAALGSYAIGYRFYSRFILHRVLKADRNRATPAERLNDGVDFHPTDRRVLLGHHFAAISGAGPLVGPVLAAQMGYLPGTIWIIVGVIFAGAVQDMVVLFFSTRRNGKSLGRIAREEIGPIGGVAALVAVFTIMIILIAVLSLVVLNALAESPWGTFSTAMSIPIALFMGVYLRWIRPGRVAEVSALGIVLLLFAITAGSWVADSSWAAAFTLDKSTLVVWLVVYGFVASVLPVWMLLAPRDYLSTFMKIGTIGLLAVGIVVTLPMMKMEAVTDFATRGDGPVFAGSLFPFVFITIACGALSGFHALISSGTTPKMIQKETQVRMVGYGGMLMESSVAVMAMTAACILDPGLFFAMNAPPAIIGDTLESASQTITGWGYTITPDQLAEAAREVEEGSILSRTGGAPTFALGVAYIFAGVIGGSGMVAFWYHFAIMFEVLFILTAIDSGTRVGRFMLQEMIGNTQPLLSRARQASWMPAGLGRGIGRMEPTLGRFREVGWMPGAYLTSAVVVLAWGYFLWVGVHDPLGGINQLFPIFGISNQLLAAVALTVCTVLLVKSGRLKWAWVTGVPLVWDAVVTLTASWQKVFSGDPRVGFFSQRARAKEQIASGEFSGQELQDLQTIVTNTTVQGTLSAVFAVLIVVVIADAARICVKAVRNPETVELKEAPFEQSRLIAPAGLFPTREEKAELEAAGLGPGGGVPEEREVSRT
ncbi:carbon starvation CstA family protein [Streptomyces sp. 549]|uniref:carbon starvation CstA family protein n=1 Tax=Streptomyces sp. 549 TaxID=3049076 RepID=UPI0024C2A394|nr:carbon starvation CstA family protein [Streptomyces sp. 549]MDK1476681.1 carbon starvation CstA family protein [Streptomyces sp. 549]